MNQEQLAPLIHEHTAAIAALERRIGTHEAIRRILRVLALEEITLGQTLGILAAMAERSPDPEPQGLYQQAMAALRQHWLIENRVHYVRDVSYGEDRLRARKTAQVLAWARNLGIAILRRRHFKFIPDGWRFTSAHPQAVLGWLTGLEQHGKALPMRFTT